MSSVNLPYDNEVISYLSTTFFEGNQEIGEIIQDYSEELSISYLIDTIVKKSKSSAADALKTYLSRNISFIPNLVQVNLSDVEGLKKVCLFIFEKRHLFSTTQKYRGWCPIHGVAEFALLRLNYLNPVNTEDGISRDLIDDRDLVIIFSGQRFSLTMLVDYHNARDYKGTKGEQHGNKFLFNHLTNDFFSFRDVETIVCRAIKSGKELQDLNTFSCLPRSSVQPISWESLDHFYKTMKATILSSSKEENKKDEVEKEK
jgi:hypothetical protein